MKPHIPAIICIVCLMFFNAILEPAKRAAQAEYLAHHLSDRYQIDKYEAWDFFSEVLDPPVGLFVTSIVESAPYLIAIAVLYIHAYKNKKPLHE